MARQAGQAGNQAGWQLNAATWTRGKEDNARTAQQQAASLAWIALLAGSASSGSSSGATPACCSSAVNSCGARGYASSCKHSRAGKPKT